MALENIGIIRERLNTPTPQNFFSVPTSLPNEIIQTLLQTPDVRIERIVSQGHSSSEGFWYDQDTHEWVMVVSGAARLRFESEAPFEMKAGSFINIPAHKRHRVEWTDPKQETIWLAIHYAQAESNR